MRILAIDGALHRSGWVVLDDNGGTDWGGVKLCKYGVIKTDPQTSLGFRLLYLRKELIKILERYQPEVAVFEETYIGSNLKTASRLNNAKGVILMTLFEYLDADPTCVTAVSARACLGFKNGKNPKVVPWEHFSSMYNIKGTFASMNDVTDACVLGWYRIFSQRGQCQVKLTKARKAAAQKKAAIKVSKESKNDN